MSPTARSRPTGWTARTRTCRFLQPGMLSSGGTFPELAVPLLHPATEALRPFPVRRVADDHEDRRVTLDLVGLAAGSRDRLVRQPQVCLLDIGVVESVGDEELNFLFGDLSFVLRLDRLVDPEFRDRERPRLLLESYEAAEQGPDLGRDSASPSSSATVLATVSMTDSRKVPVPIAGSTIITSSAAKPRLMPMRVRGSPQPERTMAVTTSFGV